jgi:DNA-binding LacI/PurR family transcriptional regulator
MYLELQADQLWRMFNKALKDDCVTAWVGSNDEVAVECLRYLRERKIAVPHHVSVVGFDDSTIALTHRLSSYSFNPEGAIHVLLEHITRPRSPLFKNYPPGASVPVEGYVNQRMTTARRPVKARP